MIFDSLKKAAYDEGFRAAMKQQKTPALQNLLATLSEEMIPKKVGEELIAAQLEDIAIIVSSEQYPSLRRFLLLQIQDYYERASGSRDEQWTLLGVAKHLKELVLSMDQMKRVENVPESSDVYHL